MLGKDFISTRFLPSAIFAHRKRSWFKILLQTILVGMLLSFSIIWQFLRMNPDELMESMLGGIYGQVENWSSAFPLGEIDNGLFHMELEEPVIFQADNQFLIFDKNGTFTNWNEMNHYLILREDFVQLRYGGFVIYANYDVSIFHSFSLQDNSPKDFLHSLAEVLAMSGFILVLQMVYPLIIGMNIIFILFLSLMSMLVNFASKVKLSFKEFCTVWTYASTLPAILGLALGVFLSIAYVYMIFNFGTIAMGFIIYRKYIK